MAGPTPLRAQRVLRAGRDGGAGGGGGSKKVDFFVDDFVVAVDFAFAAFAVADVRIEEAVSAGVVDAAAVVAAAVTAASWAKALLLTSTTLSGPLEAMRAGSVGRNVPRWT